MNGRNPHKNEALKRELAAKKSHQPQEHTAMSLESQIETLNVNFAKLIGLLQGGAIPATPENTKAVKNAKVNKEDDAARQALQDKRDAANPTIDYEKQVKPAVLAFAAKNGRDALIAALKPFGITTAKDAKPEQYAELLKALGA